MKYAIKKRCMEKSYIERLKLRPELLLEQREREPEVVAVFETYSQAFDEIRKYKTTEEYFIEPIEDEPNEMSDLETEQ